MTQKHSPLPRDLMTFEPDGERSVYLIGNYNGIRKGFAEIFGETIDGERFDPFERAAFIVRACNNHYKLVEALKQISQYGGSQTDDADRIFGMNNTMRDIADKALAEAEAE